MLHGSKLRFLYFILKQYLRNVNMFNKYKVERGEKIIMTVWHVQRLYYGDEPYYCVLPYKLKGMD